MITKGRICTSSMLYNRFTQFAAISDKVYQLLTQGRWFSPGTPASSTTKTGRHDIAEILLKVALSTNNLIKSSIYIKNCSVGFKQSLTLVGKIIY
jgi:hypothetical protein